MKVTKSVTVNAPVERAFRVFTEEIGKWWPLAEGYAYAGDRAQNMFLEGREGGRVYERSRDGEEFHIGTVKVFDPPSRLVFTWGEATEEWGAPTEVEVIFVAEGDATRLVLEHRGFERIGEPADETFRSYDRGWTGVLAGFERYAA
jgi:uncharacterized protein YndB with AHSA1/START domain